MKERKTHSFNVMMTETEYQTLIQLAEVMQRTKAGAIRACLKQAASMLIHGIPQCADGTACLASHLMFPRQVAPQHQMRREEAP